jgi:hypothetical protein
MMLIMVLWVLISARLSKRAMLMLWHAFLVLGLLFAWWPILLFLVSKNPVRKMCQRRNILLIICV